MLGGLQLPFLIAAKRKASQGGQASLPSRYVCSGYNILLTSVQKLDEFSLIDYR
jgi:hypothetical protein